MIRRGLALAALAVAAIVPLAGCVQNESYCRYAEYRRTGYESAITAADLYASTHPVVPDAVTLGRQAAVTALDLLNTRCPQAQ